MRRYLLDAPLLSALLLSRPVAVELVASWIEQREAATSILVYAEVNEYLLGRPDYSTADEDFRHVPGLPLIVVPRSQLSRRPAGR
jgi:hypothetical protein